MDEDRSLWNSSCIQMAFGSLCRNAAAVNDLLLSATTLKHLVRKVLSKGSFSVLFDSPQKYCFAFPYLGLVKVAKW